MVTDKTNQTIKLKDDRTLGYAEYGDLEGKQVFHFHGHPGSRLQTKLIAEVAAKLGIRIIGIDRPGMGLSAFKPGRQILDWPDDVVQLADALEIDHFAVEGASGGGPYAAVCAYKIPDRLTACGIVAGVGPIDLLSTKGMMMSNRLQFFIARWAPWLLIPLLWLFLGRNRRHIQDEKRIEDMSSNMMRQLSEVDRKAMNDPLLRKLFVLYLFEAFRQGSKGPACEAKLYARPWGFRLEDISLAKVYLWHGELDLQVPISMGRAMVKAIPNCKARFNPNDAHMSVALNHLEEIMEAMIS